MRERRGARAGRRRGVLAIALLVLGALLLTAGAASASSVAGEQAIITFWNNDNVVTLNIPSQCPMGQPSCVWMLWVNEPDIPAQTVVGFATGTSGVLTVAYPTNFCGVLQADVLVGPAPWRLLYGHRMAIQTGSCTCPPTQTASSTGSPSSANSTASAPAHSRGTAHRGALHLRSTNRGPRHPRSQSTGATTTTTTAATGSAPIMDASCAPITGATNVVPPSQLPFTGTTSAEPAATSASPASPSGATLPFTGLDVKPLLIAGSVLMVVGLGLLTTFEQRRYALRSAVSSVRSSRVVGQGTRLALWFFGE